MEERNGFLTPEQEKKLDELIELKGFYETFDRMAIRLADNMGLQKLKEKIIATNPELLTIVYQVIDEIFAAFPDKEQPAEG